MNPKWIKNIEDYAKAQHNQDCWKPVKKREILKAARGKDTHTYIHRTKDKNYSRLLKKLSRPKENRDTLDLQDFPPKYF